MLNKILMCVIVCTLFSLNVLAQTADKNNGFEIFAGYSNNQVDVGSTNNSNFRDMFAVREHLGGIEVSGVKNISRFFGIKGDFSVNSREVKFTLPPTVTGGATESLRLDASLYNFLGGIQFKDNRREGSRVRPFGHVLVGAAYGRTSLKSYTTNFCDSPGISCAGLDNDDTGFAAAIGGGIDVRINKRITIRAIQVDYNPTRLNRTTQHNFRFSFGVVFH